MKFIKYCLLFLVTACVNPVQETTSCHQILTYIENHLPLSGVLKKSGDFVYLDLDDEYVHKLIPFIENDGFQAPPYFGRPDLVGAHITVLYSPQVQKYEIDELGEKICFSLKECQIVHPPNWEGIDKIYLIVVDSPDLDKIRHKYGFPPKEYNFHITIGVKS